MNTTTTPNNKVKEIIGKAKAVPLAAYLLVLLNVIMIVGLVCEDLPLHYLVGMACFAVCLVAAVGAAVGCCQGPSPLISEEVITRVRELQERLMASAKTLNAEELQSKSVNVIITILLIIYTSSILNGTFEIFLIVNTLYCLVFLPKQTDSCFDCCKGYSKQLLGKIQYHK